MNKMNIEIFVKEQKEELEQLLLTLARIPAPSGKEERRAEFCLNWLHAHGAKEAYVDRAGNVVYLYRRQAQTEDDLPIKMGHEMDMTAQKRNGAGNPLVVFDAHMDVVFPDETELPLYEEEGKVFCPGVGDDTANLAVLLMTAAYAAKYQPDTGAYGILFVCSVGEEGLGNLKGVREIAASFGEQIEAFYSFDLHLDVYTSKAVGSLRYRISAQTKGGHSYGDFGNANAIAVLAELITELYGIKVPERGKTTYNVGMISGGTSVNTIAQRAEMLYEIRSDDYEDLMEMKAGFREVLAGYPVAGKGDAEAINIDRGKTGHGMTEHGMAEHGMADQGMAEHGMAEHGTTEHGMAEHGTTDYGMAEHGMADQGMAEHGMTDQGMAEHGMAEYGMADQGMAEYGMAEYGTTEHGTTDYGMAEHGMTDHGMTEHGMTEYGMADQGMAEHGMAGHGMTEHGMAGQGMAEHGMAEHGMASQGMAEHGMAEHGMTDHGMAEYGMADQGMADQKIADIESENICREIVFEEKTQEESGKRIQEEKSGRDWPEDIRIFVEEIGERPCEKGVDEEKRKWLFAQAERIFEQVTGKVPKPVPCSTNCNIPLSLGIPSICVGMCDGAGAHTREEYVVKESLVKGMEAALKLLDEVQGIYKNSGTGNMKEKLG